jgi:hypothetical protein
MRTTIARRNVVTRAALLCLFVAGFVGCQSASRWWNPTSGYEAAGNPEIGFDAAKAGCEKESEFTDSSGMTHVNWNQFELCMEPKGWIRP